MALALLRDHGSTTVVIESQWKIDNMKRMSDKKLSVSCGKRSTAFFFSGTNYGAGGPTT